MRYTVLSDMVAGKIAGDETGGVGQGKGDRKGGSRSNGRGIAGARCQKPWESEVCETPNPLTP